MKYAAICLALVFWHMIYIHVCIGFLPIYVPDICGPIRVTWTNLVMKTTGSIKVVALFKTPCRP